MEEKFSQKTQMSAKSRALKLLAQRDHTEVEMRIKLGKFYSEDEVNTAIQAVSKWLLPPDEMSERLKTSLGRRGKGIRWINQSLKAKGLPTVKADPRDELEKATSIMNTKRFKSPAHAMRHLIGRGFSHEVVLQLIKKGKYSQHDLDE